MAGLAVPLIVALSAAPVGATQQSPQFVKLGAVVCKFKDGKLVVFKDPVSAGRTNKPCVPDLSVAKTVDHSSVKFNDHVVWSVTVSNGLGFTIPEVRVTDLLPTGVQFVKATAPAGTTFDAQTGLWRLPNGLMPGTSKTLAIEVIVDPAQAGSVQNCASAAGFAPEVKLPEYGPPVPVLDKDKKPVLIQVAMAGPACSTVTVASPSPTSSPTPVTPTPTPGGGEGAGTPGLPGTGWKAA